MSNDTNQQEQQKIPHQKTKRKVWLTPIIALALVVAGIGLLVAFPPQWNWMGIGESSQKSSETIETIDGKVTKTTTTTKYDSSKTLWDWMSLILAPLTLAGIGFWFQSSQEQERESKVEIEKKQAEMRARQEKERNEANQREDALEA